MRPASLVGDTTGFYLLGVNHIATRLRLMRPPSLVGDTTGFYLLGVNHIATRLR